VSEREGAYVCKIKYTLTAHIRRTMCVHGARAKRSMCVQNQVHINCTHIRTRPFPSFPSHAHTCSPCRVPGTT
jgi:hypothetical protein